MTPNLPQEKHGKAQWDHLEGLSLPFLHTPRRKLPTTAFQRGGRATYTLPPPKKRRGKEGSSSLLRGRDQKRSGGREKKPCHPAIIDGGEILTRLWW